MPTASTSVSIETYLLSIQILRKKYQALPEMKHFRYLDTTQIKAARTTTPVSKTHVPTVLIYTRGNVRGVRASGPVWTRPLTT